jgi:hypothetical protein
MKTLHLLILILGFGNCVITNFYYPDGIEKKDVKVLNHNTSKPIVNISLKDITKDAEYTSKKI